MNEHLATTDSRKQKVGRVVSTKMNKTVVVAVDYLRPHPLYRKTVRQTSKFYAHDENNECHVGDTVVIEETRPLSKLKRWRVVEIATKNRREGLNVLRQDVVTVEGETEEASS
ncbi:30S ribosomal protein S17 [Herpetosiphon gulosus]|uniref:Small ribosomal subunit protein uS17 n=1 Tax=Herpetosiphon gulosus TaxID=1973496 RepID=A0ABP9WT33_9CHLR